MIRINEQWSLDADITHWILKKRTVSKKTGRVSWQAKYWFPTIDCVIGWFTEAETRKAAHNLDSLHAINDKIQEAKRDMTEVLRVMSLDGTRWETKYRQMRSTKPRCFAALRKESDVEF